VKRSRLLLFLAALGALLAGAAGVVAATGAAQAAAPKATTHSMYVTYYGWYDNSPPGGDIAYPKKHSTAGGTGTYADPITFASDTKELSAGTVIYYAPVKKYFIMEDDCTECDEDWTGHGPDGGPNLWHVDLWSGGKGGNEMLSIDCEDALTQSNADGSPKLTSVIVNPPSNEPVSGEQIFNSKTGACYGGATASSTTGRYQNGSKTGPCITDPGNATKSGTALTVTACNGAADQKFTFDGAFFTINNLCIDAKGGSTSNGTTIDLATCSGAPRQQWEVNSNGTIAGIQSNKCIQVSGTALQLAGCTAASKQKWIFTAAAS
jgi:hypothetical protein